MIDHYPEDPVAAMAAVRSMNDDELEGWLWRYPGIIQRMFQTVSERFELFDHPEMHKMAIHLARETKRKIWRGLWVGNIPADTRLLVVSTFCHGNLTQEILNFLTLVRPHMRGSGEGRSVETTEVVCRGLQVAHLALRVIGNW